MTEHYTDALKNKIKNPQVYLGSVLPSPTSIYLYMYPDTKKRKTITSFYNYFIHYTRNGSITRSIYKNGDKNRS